MYKIALVGLGVGMFLAALAPASAVDRPTRHHPRYEGRSIYAPPPPVYEGRSAFAPAAPITMAPYGHRGGGCFVTNSPIESEKGIRHWRPVC
jgi:hypothetical protein